MVSQMCCQPLLYQGVVIPEVRTFKMLTKAVVWATAANHSPELAYVRSQS